MNETAIIVLCVVCFVIVVSLTVFLSVRFLRKRSSLNETGKTFGGLKTAHLDNTKINEFKSSVSELIDIVSELLVIGFGLTDLEPETEEILGFREMDRRFNMKLVKNTIRETLTFASLMRMHGLGPAEVINVINTCHEAERLLFRASNIDIYVIMPRYIKQPDGSMMKDPEDYPFSSSSSSERVIDLDEESGSENDSEKSFKPVPVKKPEKEKTEDEKTEDVNSYGPEEFSSSEDSEDSSPRETFGLPKRKYRNYEFMDPRWDVPEYEHEQIYKGAMLKDPYHNNFIDYDKIHAAVLKGEKIKDEDILWNYIWTKGIDPEKFESMIASRDTSKEKYHDVCDFAMRSTLFRKQKLLSRDGMRLLKLMVKYAEESHDEIEKMKNLLNDFVDIGSRMLLSLRADPRELYNISIPNISEALVVMRTKGKLKVTNFILLERDEDDTLFFLHAESVLSRRRSICRFEMMYPFTEDEKKAHEKMLREKLKSKPSFASYQMPELKNGIKTNWDVIEDIQTREKCDNFETSFIYKMSFTEYLDLFCPEHAHHRFRVKVYK